MTTESDWNDTIPENSGSSPEWTGQDPNSTGLVDQFTKEPQDETQKQRNLLKISSMKEHVGIQITVQHPSELIRSSRLCYDEGSRMTGLCETTL